MYQAQSRAAAAPVWEGGSHQTTWAIEEFVRREHLRIMCPSAAGKLVLRELAHALLTRARFSDGSDGEEVGGGLCGANR